jgi:CHAT domain-containing protein/Tfp pilus assembly protein PilF
MRQWFKWVTIAVLCWAAGAVAGEQPPPSRRAEMQAAYDKVMEHYKAGQYAAALEQGKRALALAEEVAGRGSPTVAAGLDLLGALHMEQGEYAQAKPLLERALAIREQLLGKNHPQVARSLADVADVYEKQGLYARAEPLLQRALAIQEAALGQHHPDVAASLVGLAAVHEGQKQYDRAEPLLRRALSIQEAALGTNHPVIARSLNRLSGIYFRQGLYAQAEPLCQRALAIREAALGKDHPDVATSLHNLARIYLGQGQYARAEPLLQRALAIREAALGEGHPDVAGCLEDLAEIYNGQGLYARAEPLYQRALAIQEAALGKNHPTVASLLMSLGALYASQGFVELAEPRLQRALAIREEALGKNHPEVAAALNDLANLHVERERYGQAEPLYQRSLTVAEATLGKNHPVVARTLHNLAGLYKEQGLYARAEPLYQRALAIRQATLGKDHPEVAQSLHDLALNYKGQGLYARAEPLLQRSLSLMEAALGEHHPNLVHPLNQLAQLRVAQQRLDDALPLLTRAFSLSERHMRQEALSFSDTRLNRFLQEMRISGDRLYTLLRAYPQDERVRRLALSAVLLLKGRSAEELAATSRTVYQSLSAQDRHTFEELRWVRSEFAALVLQGPGSHSQGNDSQRLKELFGRGDALEAELARRSAPLRALTALPDSSEIVSRVTEVLPRESALVEFIAYVDYPSLLKPGAPASERTPQWRYLALVLLPGAKTRAIDLGPAEAIAQAASELRDALARRDAAFLAPAQALYKAIFEPLLPWLGDTRQLFLSPDDQLNLVPFAALHDGQRFLIDTYDITYLTSGRDLLPRPQRETSTGSVVVLAAPDFSAPLPVPRASSEDMPPQAAPSSSIDRLLSSLRAGVAETTWVPLPGTRQEAQAIQRLIPHAQVFLGPEATKQRLLRLPTPAILHLATHGFFLDDAPVPEDSRAIGNFGAMGDAPPSRSMLFPLLRSGLVLAGAQPRASQASDSASSALDSSLVTALELAGLDLWGTQLVVLSACDTGRGHVMRGLGVFGLRRALVAAGAETVVMSLWKVRDDSTSVLMELYYRNLLAGQGRASALRSAMRALRATRPHPHEWAPFIVLGQNSPLRPLAPAAGEPPSQEPAHRRSPSRLGESGK